MWRLYKIGNLVMEVTKVNIKTRMIQCRLNEDISLLYMILLKAFFSRQWICEIIFSTLLVIIYI